MTNRIQELTVDKTWRNEQDAWNNRSNYFVEMHNRDDRKAQVTEFLSFLKNENLLHQMQDAVFVIMHLVQLVKDIRQQAQTCLMA